MKIGLIIALSVVLFILIFAVVGFTRFCYKNTHWYEKALKVLQKLGAVEKQANLPNGNVINYGEICHDTNLPALLLIHGQGGAWEDYSCVSEELSQKWHIFAIDVYGHGESSHNPEYYYLDKNADDIIWFIQNVIKEPVVVSGHSNGAITAAYLAAYGKEFVRGAILEDPPVFSTQGENWENSFSYLDTFKNMHDWNLSDKSECWPSYYLRNCYWGKVFMKGKTLGLAKAAQSYAEKHPGESVKISFLPPTVTCTFQYFPMYDTQYGERFYDLTWNNGLTHEKILSDIKIPCVYLHAKEGKTDDGVYLCAASREQAERAVNYIGENCRLEETPSSDHTIHAVHKEQYIKAVNSFLM